jgi:hypothetical protein
MDALLLAALTLPTLQDRPGETGARDVVYAITVEQGWTLTAETDRPLIQLTDRELVRGLQPTFRLPQTPDERDGATRFLPRDAEDLMRPPGSFPRGRNDPLRLDGTLTVHGDGTSTFAFRRIDYWDSVQRWWIEVDGPKVRTGELGGLQKWSGSREAWLDRLGKLEASFVQAYLKAVTPQAAPEAKSQIGLAMGAPDAGRRLFVTLCLEDQLAVLLLARLDGVRLPAAAWPESAAVYPPRAVQMARALVDRIVRQAVGRMPAKTRASMSWDGDGDLVPHFHLADGAAWAVEQARPVEAARRRLETLATGSFAAGGILESAWNAEVRRERILLQGALRVPLPERPLAVADPLLVPRRLTAGAGAYEVDGAGSKVEIRGAVRGMEVAFFVSGANQWRASRVRFDAWYKAEVKRKP